MDHVIASRKVAVTLREYCPPPAPAKHHRLFRNGPVAMSIRSVVNGLIDE